MSVPHSANAPGPCHDVPDRLVNLRDVALDGLGLAAGVLLRSDAPLAGDRHPDGVAWPPATVIDLRRPQEKCEVHPLADRAAVLDLPLSVRPRVTDPDTAQVWPSTLAETYVGLLSMPLAAGLVAVIEAVAAAATPILVHCSAGKDRTGVTVAVVLRLVGLAPERIVADYALTGPAMPAVRARMRATVRAVTDGAALALMPAHVFAAAPEDMATFLDALDGHDGGAAGWFSAHGGDPATVARLKGMLLA